MRSTFAILACTSLAALAALAAAARARVDTRARSTGVPDALIVGVEPTSASQIPPRITVSTGGGVSTSPSLSTLTPTSTPYAPSQAASLAPLAPLDLADMALWNWNAKWMGSEWTNPNSPLAWRYDHIRQINHGDTIFTLDAIGAPQLQAQNGIAANASGFWETDVTLPRLKDGVIIAPLWIYDASSRDEIDFEFAGRKGLDVSMHCVVNGVPLVNTVRLFAGVDMSGQRKRFGIKVNQAAGFVEMYVDGVMAYRWNRSSMSFFIKRPMKPFIEMWPTNPSYPGFVLWAGKWPGLIPGERLLMTVHGYGYRPLAI